ncbi:MAG: FAD-dependent oxidoreductase [Maioricimonas sp. JB049]
MYLSRRFLHRIGLTAAVSLATVVALLLLAAARAEETSQPTSVRPASRGPVLANSPEQVDEQLTVDVLVVGGSESAVAAAVQAARLGVGSIALVNDIDWLGGQFTAEGLGAVDEWTIYKGRKEPFPRSGMFLEIMDAIEADMERKYGLKRPGNSWTAWTTCEPRDTEALFRKLIVPYLPEQRGPIRLFSHYEPEGVLGDGSHLKGVVFAGLEGTSSAGKRLRVDATLTIDASDWGDVIRLSGAEYMAGPDLKHQFNEPSAPESFDGVGRNEMNPITGCMVLRESDVENVIDPPEHYDPRTYYGAVLETQEEFAKVGWPRGVMKPHSPVWVDSDVPNGPYGAGRSVYTHRRLVDRRHNNLPAGTECLLVNWPLQDYPLYNFPQHVVDALEATGAGASQKNIVDMTPDQRRIVFADAREHALGLLYFLQTVVADKQPEDAVTFRTFRLTDEFGTADGMPLKPYIREGLRLSALYVLREQDVRDRDGIQSWASAMPTDAVFGYQFNIDFHPTKRIFPGEVNSGPWAHIHTKYRHWGTHTDRAGFPLRSLIPREHEGLIGAGKNLGYTSIVSSAVRLHGHGMLVGQAAATVAAVAIKNGTSPRALARTPRLIREVQRRLVSPPVDPRTGTRPPGVLLWPYQDAPPDAPWFAAANHLATAGILPGVPGRQDFEPERLVTRREVARALARSLLAARELADRTFSDFEYTEDFEAHRPVFRDVGGFDPDYAAIESLVHWGLITKKEGEEYFHPDQTADQAFLGSLLNSFDVEPDAGDENGATAVSRADLASVLYRLVGEKGLRPPANERLLTPGNDADGDGIMDLTDPLPLDRDNDNIPDRFDADADGDGLADRIRNLSVGPIQAFNFTGRPAIIAPGYVNDHGEVFSEERGYGWREDIQANHRRRGKYADPVLDTFLFTRETATWECEVENGTYRVTACIGDSGFVQKGQVVTIEGVPLARNQTTAINQFFEKSAVVEVKDGRLTVDIGSPRQGVNTCLNRLRFSRVE